MSEIPKIVIRTGPKHNAKDRINIHETWKRTSDFIWKRSRRWTHIAKL